MATCKGCGATIEWLRSPDGKTMPAQRIQTIYRTERGNPGQLERLAVGDTEDTEPVAVYVSHFKTCPKAANFTKRGRAAPARGASSRDRDTERAGASDGS